MRKAKVEETRKEMEKAITLWKNTSKLNGNVYLKGYDLNKNEVIGFFETSKKNEKQPDLKIYTVKDKKADKEICALWIRESKDKKEYFSGLTDDKESVVGFINEKATEKIPYLNVYFSENNTDKE